jgi:hypothetical protein
LSFEHRGLFGWQLEIIIDAIEVAERGMPTSRETKVLDEIGDAIELVLTRATTKQGAINALFLARVTCDSRRELVYRVHDPDLANGALAHAVTQHNIREWSFAMFRDDGWEAAHIFMDLYESAE